jgi:hypothetical protein
MLRYCIGKNTSFSGTKKALDVIGRCGKRIDDGIYTPKYSSSRQMTTPVSFLLTAILCEQGCPMFIHNDFLSAPALMPP